MASGRYFADEIMLAADGAWHDIKITLPAVKDRGPLVLRSCRDTPCRAKVRMHSVQVSDPFDTQQTVDEFLAAGEAMLKEHSAKELRQGRASTALRNFLKQIATACSMSLLEPADAAFSDALNLLSDKQLITFAKSQLLPATATPFRDWCFDWAAGRPEPHWQLRTALWRAMRDRCPDVELEMPWLEGTHVRMPLKSDLSFPLFTLGQFEPNICAALAPMIKPGETFIDVGANEGLYTLLAAARVGKSGKVIAIEPSPRELNRLRANIARNSFKSRVAVIDQALSNEAGWAEFAVANEAHSGQNAFLDIVARNIAINEVRPTPLLTLDMIAARLGSRIVDFVKIDVEGAELEVIEGGLSVLEQQRPTWVVEVGRSDAPSTGAVERLFREAGYKIFVVDDHMGQTRLLCDAQIETAENILAIPSERAAKVWPNKQGT